MTQAEIPLPSSRDDYPRLTRTATYSFLAALPLLILYEVLILFVNQGQLMQVRVGADVWVKSLLAAVGLSGTFWLTFILIAAGTFFVLDERRRRGATIPLRARYFGWMILESLVYSIVLAFLVSGVVGALFAAAPSPQSFGLLTQLALSLGAGLYEELVFRVFLVGGLYALLKRVHAHRPQAYLIAAIVGALVFSAVHYIGSLGDAFTLSSFTFRFLFGLALNGVYLLRGFGIAAWTHALYDVLVVTRFFG